MTRVIRVLRVLPQPLVGDVEELCYHRGLETPIAEVDVVASLVVVKPVNIRVRPVAARLVPPVYEALELGGTRRRGNREAGR